MYYCVQMAEGEQASTLPTSISNLVNAPCSKKQGSLGLQFGNVLVQRTPSAINEYHLAEHFALFPEFALFPHTVIN